MRTLLIGVAAAGFVAAVTSANAAEQTSAQGSAATQAPAASQPSATQAPSSKTEATASASKELLSKELSGSVKKVDKDKRSLKVLSSAGVEQDVKIAPTATVMRDGTQAGLEQLKEGDEVRVSFDPSSNEATKLDVQSKQTMEKDKGKTEMKSETKTESKAK